MIDVTSDIISPTPVQQAGVAAERVPVAERGDAFELRFQEALEAARQTVATALIMPILDALHAQTFGTDLFSPGTAEKRFSPLLDQHLADRIADSPNFPLVNALAERLVGVRREVTDVHV